MKKFPLYTLALVIVILAISLLTGCTTYYSDRGGNRVSWINANPQKWIANNTPYLLRVTQDGVVIADRLQPGAQVPVQPRLLCDRTTVIATAYGLDYQHEALVGTDTYTFRGLNPEVWVVDEVKKIRQSR